MRLVTPRTRPRHVRATQSKRPDSGREWEARDLSPNVGVLIISVLLTTTIACTPADLSKHGSDRPYNVVLVSVDTLRPDHLGCYGYDLPTSVSIDAFSDDAVLFRQAISHAPSTLPSHASIFTSLLPQHHGASFADRVPLSPEAVTLAEVLDEYGYETVAFADAGQLHPDFGVSQGFDTWQFDKGRLHDKVLMAIEWLDQRAPGPFLLFVHSYEVHHDYTPKKWRLNLFDADYEGRLPDRIRVDLLREINDGEIEIDDADLQHIIHAYDAEIQAMDEAFGELIEALRRNGIYEDTVIVLTSDHGEEFGEHGAVGWHSLTLWDEVLRVPLILKLPASEHSGRYAGKEIASAVRSIDIAPTVLALLGIEPPAQFEGVDLRPLLDRPGRDLPAVSSRDQPDVYGHSTALRTGDWKLYDGRLYDLHNDPGETVDVAPEHPDVVRQLEDQLAAMLANRPKLTADPIQPDAETVERLEALGYLD